MNDMLEQYFESVLRKFNGDTTEASFYSVLEFFVSQIARDKGLNNIVITAQPKRQVAGIPDFTVRKGKELIGYIEAKDIGFKLEDLEYSDQIEKYKQEFDNFIFTNYFDFWLWRKSEKKWVMKVSASVAPLLPLRNGQTPGIQNEKELLNLVEAFFHFSIPERKTAKSLATELAIKAKLIPAYIVEELNNNIRTPIDQIYDAFKQFLIPDLAKEDFANIYAQTITYGLFVARLRYPGKDFNRFVAQQYIPQSIRILRDTFALISGSDLPKTLDWIVDDISTILAYADIEKIKDELRRKKGGDDPLMHFYETFLAEYDPKARKARGVYYTPLPVVSFITRSINKLLKLEFGKAQGFASDGVTILDPASGTLTFPANAIMIAKEEVDAGASAGLWLQIVKNHILKDFYAFELLMAPYVIGHLKIALLLEELGYKADDNDRFPLYLTNTLDFSVVETSKMFFAADLSEEAQRAKEVKEKTKVLVVMGNPPYSGHSANASEIKIAYTDGKGNTKYRKEKTWIGNLIESYKMVDGHPLGEKNPKWLQDDYVKFIRFSQWKIEKSGEGIVGIITNHSWLDNPTFRGMRQSLLNEFNEIYILDLHGNALKKEKCADGSPDENVFDIQAGVAIAFFVKKIGAVGCRVFHSEIKGKREEKYESLLKMEFDSVKWQELAPKSESYYFIPRDEKQFKKYDKFTKITEIFPTNSVGIVTARDEFAIKTDQVELRRDIAAFVSPQFTDNDIAQRFGLKDKANWKVGVARGKIKNDSDWENQFTRILYRPFDARWIFYNDSVIERARREVMRNMLEPNLALSTMRQCSGDTFQHVLVANGLVESCYVSNKTKEINYVFPLYLYKEKQKQIFSGQKTLGLVEAQTQLDDVPEKRANIAPVIFDKLKAAYGKKPSAEDIFYYIYGVLYSNIYRKKYNEFLKSDFPRVPFTADKVLFAKIGKLGKELADLHLLVSKKLDHPLAKFPVSFGEIMKDGRMEKRAYNAQEKRIYINEKQYFEPVAPEIWNYYIGGYQVLDKWLKDRVGNILSPEDVAHYSKMIAAIKYTIDLQKELDDLYPQVEKSLLQLL
jgi:predicted helicase